MRIQFHKYNVWIWFGKLCISFGYWPVEAPVLLGLIILEYVPKIAINFFSISIFKFAFTIHVELM